MNPYSCLIILQSCRQFSPTLCEAEGCSIDSISQFTIHGLWPQYTDGYPTYCADDTFSVSSLEKNTLNQMNCEWDSYTTSTNFGNNENFWGHEWEKHGTCSLSVLPTQEDYFSSTLKAHDTYDIDVALEDAGIDMAGSTVGTDDVQQALSDAFGVDVVLKCTSGNIKEIWMCLEKDTLEAFNCPSSLKNGCSSSTEFPKADGSVEASCEQYFPGTTTGTSETRQTTVGLTSSGFIPATAAIALVVLGSLLT